MWSSVCWVQNQQEESFGLDTCKGGRQKLVHSGRIIYHRDRWGWQTSISRCLWLVGSWSHFRKSYWDNHLTGRSNAMLIWFLGIQIVSIPPCCMVIWGLAESIMWWHEIGSWSHKERWTEVKCQVFWDGDNINRNAWLWQTKGGFRMKDLSSMMQDLILTMEKIWFCNKEGYGTLKTSISSKWHLETNKGVNILLRTWQSTGSLKNRLKITNDWKFEKHLVTVKDLGSPGIRTRAKDQSLWNDH